MTITEKIRTATRTVMAYLTNKGKASVRKIAAVTGLSKSAVHRHLQLITKRPKYPESILWDSPEGEAWLRRLVFSVWYDFGLNCNIGAEQLSTFFERIRINTHVGISPSSLRTQLRQMEQILPEFQAICEAQAVQETDKTRHITAAADETFLCDLLRLVFMDLSSGYLLLEGIADDRRFETWLEAVKPRLADTHTEVDHLITDRAKALIKLATQGLKCESGADLFHSEQILSRHLGNPFGVIVKPIIR